VKQLCGLFYRAIYSKASDSEVSAFVAEYEENVAILGKELKQRGTAYFGGLGIFARLGPAYSIKV